MKLLCATPGCDLRVAEPKDQNDYPVHCWRHSDYDCQKCGKSCEYKTKVTSGTGMRLSLCCGAPALRRRVAAQEEK